MVDVDQRQRNWDTTSANFQGDAPWNNNLPATNRSGMFRDPRRGSPQQSGISFQKNINANREAAESMMKVGIGSIGDITPPRWWESQVGGKAYGPHYKFGPQDYEGTFNLEPGETYSYRDLIGNKMLNQNDWGEYEPYRRSNPLLKSHWSGIGSEVPDELLYDYNFNDEGELTGYSYNPYKDENNALMGDWLPEDYRISPYLDMDNEVFEFRDFPWMNQGDSVLTETFPNQEALETGNLENFDLFHLMSNGYTLEEAQQILSEQGLA